MITIILSVPPLNKNKYVLIQIWHNWKHQNSKRKIKTKLNVHLQMFSYSMSNFLQVNFSSFFHVYKYIEWLIYLTAFQPV